MWVYICECFSWRVCPDKVIREWSLQKFSVPTHVGTPMIPCLMLIDDDPVQHYISTRLVVDMGFALSLQSFMRADEAINQLRAHSLNADVQMPDLILLDIHMPVMDGWEFLDVVTANPGILGRAGVMLLSSSISPLDIDRSRQYACVVDYLQKPLTRKIFNELKYHEKLNHYFREE